MKIPKGKKVVIGGNTFVGEMPDDLAKAYNISFGGEKPKPKPVEKKDK